MKPDGRGTIWNALAVCFDYAIDLRIWQLMRSFALEYPILAKPIFLEDLALVLHVLLGHPYELIEAVFLKLLT